MSAVARRVPVYVLDTNALISAALTPGGTARAALDIALSTGEVAMSAWSWAELRRVLERPKIARAVSQATRDKLIGTLLDGTITVEASEPVSDCRDADDNNLLSLAYSAKASAIVSGDPDLLVLNPWRKIPILVPGAFLGWLTSQPG